ncbi:hypothetical protein [Kordiimonas sp.]|uniref:hypothetical protein n=1 Tax=Kordiimonas sp. TaxID=1970157 RepID=UPI003A92F38F
MTYMPNRYSHAPAGKAHEPHAGEITALVQELKRRKLALEGKVRGGCKDGCTDCAPCTKGRTEQQECEDLLLNINHGNTTRWRARAKLGRAIRKLARAREKFADDYDAKILSNAGWAALDTIEVAVTKKPEDFAKAMGSVYTLVRSLLNYNQEYASELSREVGPFASDVERIGKTAEHLERIFWQQVRYYAGRNCPASLTPQHFNRP